MGSEDSSRRLTEPKYDCLLFDVDDTLYPLDSGLAMECRKNITDYMINKLGILNDKVSEMCVQLYKDYGTTMAGLKAIGYDFDYDDFHSFVHGRLPYEILKPDPALRSLLHSLPFRKVIFSNANQAHVAEILSRLGLEDCFDDVVCFETLNPTAKQLESSKEETASSNGCYNGKGNAAPAALSKFSVVCKPFEDSFEKTFKLAGIDPQRTLFFDDSIRNLQTAKRMGLSTVRVGSSQSENGVDYALERIHYMKEAFPELWAAV